MQRKQKIEKLMMRKVATSRKSKNHNRQLKHKTHFSLLVFDCDFEGALSILISLNEHETLTVI